MDWDRIENARNRARSIFAIAFLAIALVAFAQRSAPKVRTPCSANALACWGYR